MLRMAPCAGDQREDSGKNNYHVTNSNIYLYSVRLERVALFLCPFPVPLHCLFFFVLRRLVDGI